VQTTLNTYAKARESHQAGEKSQVATSSWFWSVVLDRFVAVA
jgi:hypothetical protein